MFEEGASDGMIMAEYGWFGCSITINISLDRCTPKRTTLLPSERIE